MKIGIRYETVYRYDRAVRFSPHDVRRFPRSDRFVQIARLDFRTKPETTVRFGRDVFDNVVASCFFEEAAEALGISPTLVRVRLHRARSLIVSRLKREKPGLFGEPRAGISAGGRSRSSRILLAPVR